MRESADPTAFDPQLRSLRQRHAAIARNVATLWVDRGDRARALYRSEVATLLEHDAYDQ